MREPDVNGITGRGWKAAPAKEVLAGWPAGLDMWLMHVPGAHPLWSWYVVSAVSLADIAGVKPATKRTPSSTHELVVIALAPEFQPSDAWCSQSDQRWSRHILRPLNLCEQVESFDDEKVNELAFLFVRAFCNGHANPDDDFRSYNKQVFAATVDHLKRGLHEVH